MTYEIPYVETLRAGLLYNNDLAVVVVVSLFCLINKDSMTMASIKEYDLGLEMIAQDLILCITWPYRIGIHLTNDITSHDHEGCKQLVPIPRRASTFT